MIDLFEAAMRVDPQDPELMVESKNNIDLTCRAVLH